MPFHKKGALNDSRSDQLKRARVFFQPSVMEGSSQIGLICICPKMGKCVMRNSYSNVVSSYRDTTRLVLVMLGLDLAALVGLVTSRLAGFK